MRDPSHIPPSERPEVRADRDALSGQAAAAGPEPAGMLMDRLLELEELLAEYLSTRVSVTMGTNKGKVVIEFADLEDLERIYHQMTTTSGS